MEENFDYQLSQKLEYSKKGEFEKTATISFRPPAMAEFELTCDLEQIMMGAMMSVGKNQVSQQSEEDVAKAASEMVVPSAKEIRMILFMSQEIKFSDIAGKFKKLAVATGMLDDSTPLKMDHFKQLSIQDFQDMICGYASFFTFPSLLRGA